MSDIPLFEKKAIPVTITGLSNAGKTTFVQRLITGEYHENPLPTMGLSVERFEYQSVLFQLFDLGGQTFFRDHLWREYISLSQGIIFIFDSTGELIDEARKSFWKVAEWAPEDTTVMFLANKWDLDHLPLDKIVTNLDLQQFSTTPSRSFQIFDVSMKTGQNIERAMDWFSSKLLRQMRAKKITLYRVLILLSSGVPIVDLEFGSRKTGSTHVSGFMSAINQYIKKIIGESEGLQRIETDEYQVLMTKYEHLFCVIVCGLEDSPSKVRTVAESVLRFGAGELRERGKFQLPTTIRDYLEEYFNEEVFFPR
ncbi:MAG: ADP-ribosylation factor-like protein [Candidatus Hodarchaeales archaeon]